MSHQYFIEGIPFWYYMQLSLPGTLIKGSFIGTP